MDKVIESGHTACLGCGEILGVRMLVENLGKDTIICQATSCMEITTTSYPYTSFNIPWIHVTFENAASVASGVSRALIKQGKENVTVVAMGGDGGMADIGFRSISGALERNENILIICTDNEAYMNTGIQRSSMTPLFSWTTTSPAGKKIPGKRVWKKPLAEIIAAHQIPYVATASIAYPADLKNKIDKAKKIKGPKFIHIHTPCPIGWKYDPAKTVEVGRLAVETGLWALFEIENNKFKMTYKPDELKPLKDYLSLQKRFKHMTPDLTKKMETIAHEQYNRLLEREKC